MDISTPVGVAFLFYFIFTFCVVFHFCSQGVRPANFTNPEAVTCILISNGYALLGEPFFFPEHFYFQNMNATMSGISLSLFESILFGSFIHLL